MQQLEKMILESLVFNEAYARKVLPFLKMEYFSGASTKILFSHIHEFMEKYNHCPSTDSLKVIAEVDIEISEKDYADILDTIQNFSQKNTNNLDWLIAETEKFCKDRAVYNAILNSIKIIDGQNSKSTAHAIPGMLEEALAVSFNTSIGHDYLEDTDERFEFYHSLEERIPFDLTMMNKITRGGLTRKSLTVILAGTGVGKSLAMCHMAAAALSQMKNVLYVTLEMSEEKIAERIDANLLGVPVESLETMPKENFMNRMNRLKMRIRGRLIIKEYPTTFAHAGHLKALLNELRLKKNFVPDIIFVDYLNICSSSRIKASAGANSYIIVKSIAEEMRGLAVEFDVPLVTATQVTRSGFGNTDIELTDTSESFGLPHTADLMFAMISTEELESMNQIMIKQLKNRYNDPSTNKKFLVGIDRSQMRLYDLESDAQRGIQQ